MPLENEIFKSNAKSMNKIDTMINSNICNTFLLETYSILCDEINARHDNFIEDKNSYEKYLEVETHLVNVSECLTPIFLKIQNDTNMSEDEKLSHALIFFIITESIFVGYQDEEIYAFAIEDDMDFKISFAIEDDSDFKISFAESLESMIMATWFIHPSDIDYFYSAYLKDSTEHNYHQVLENIIMDELSEIYYEDVKSIISFKHENNHGDLIGWANNRHIPRAVADLKKFEDVFTVLNGSNLLMYTVS